MNVAGKENHGEIVRCLNPNELFSCLCEHDLLDIQDGELILNDSILRREKNELILAKLDSKGPAAYHHFLECLAEETEHLGHAYILCRLRGGVFAEEEEVHISRRIQKLMKRRMRDLVEGVNVCVLAPYLLKYSLLTTDEYEHTNMSSQTRKEGVLYLLRILDTKGPTAHYTFARCLEEGSEHCTHQELLQMITNEDDFKLISQKRKRTAPGEDSTQFQPKRKVQGDLVAVTTRYPDRLRAQGTLLSRDYFDSVKRIRRCHLTGNWEQADTIVKECIQKGDRELRIAVTLEDCTGYITRRQRDTVLLKVGRAMQLCEELPSDTDNRCFLTGRCEWVLAKLYRYTGEMEKALKHIQEASEHQSGIASGEDAALTTYCHACILLERLNDPDHYETRSPDDEKNAKDLFERAINYASNNPEYGLDLSHPRIRLAQLYLGSSPSRPGTNQDPSTISKARNSLKAVNFDALAHRTKCIFYYTKSDLVYYHSKDEARDFAQRSLDIAKQNGFETEMSSAHARLDRF